MKRVILLLLGIIFALVLSVSAWGSTGTIPTYTLTPEDYEPQEDEEDTEYFYTLAEILDAAEAGDEDGNAYSEIIINLTWDYNMAGEGEDDECLLIDEDTYETLKTVTITGGHKLISGSGARHFIINDPDFTLRFENIELTGTSGGGIELNAGTLEAVNTTFNKCGISRTTGGALFVAEGATATLTGCSFTGNTGLDGGAISSAGTLNIASGTSFVGNSASGSGGAVNLTEGNVTLSGVSFGDGTRSGRNIAVNGGALSVGEDASLTLTDSSINMNSADLGGGIYSEGTVTLTADTITANTAKSGGAIYLTPKATLNVTGMSNQTQSFTSNTASDEGGAIFAGRDASDEAMLNFSAPVSFSDNKAARGGAVWVRAGSQLGGIAGSVSFMNNAADYGGALYIAIENTSTLNLDSGVSWTFSGNKANYDGGAIYTVQADVAVSGQEITNENSAGEAGGFLYSGGEVTVKSSTISNQRAEYAGAIYAANGAEITDSAFESNRAAITTNPKYLGGGAVYVIGELTVNGSTFADNRVTTSFADHGGGAIFVSGDTEITGSTFDGNTYNNSNVNSEGGGGAIYALGRLSMTNSMFKKNEVRGPTGGGQGCGGVLYASNATMNILNCYFEDNLSDFNGGALYLGGNSDTTLRYSTFYLNTTSTGNGGAVYGQGILDMGTYDDRHNMSNVGANFFISNNARRNGGAVCFNHRFEGRTQLRASYSMFTNNSTSNGLGGAIYIYNDTATIESCTFTGNSASAPSESAAYGGALYMNTTETITSTVINSTFTENKVYGSGAWGGALYTFGKVSLICNTFTMNEATDRGGAIYVGSGEAAFTANIMVGNTALIGNDVCNEAQITTSGYNRIGVYGTGNASSAQNAMWSLAFNNETDRESSKWTTETFFGKNAELAINPTGNDNEPPAIGTTLDTELDQAWLLTLKLSEDVSLALVDRATNLIPFARRLSLGIPRYDAQRVDRFAAGTDITIGASYSYKDWDNTQTGDGDLFPIGSITLSGLANLKYPGQSGSLVAVIHYTNGRTAYGVPVNRTSYTRNAEEPVIWASSMRNAVSVDIYGNVTALSGTGSTGAVITVETVRLMSSGRPATASRRIIINADDFSGTYNYLNISANYMNQLYSYYESLQQFDYDLSFYLADVNSSAVKASAFQSDFSSAWSVKATQITDLTQSAPTFSTATSYTGSSGLVSSKKGAVNISFRDRTAGDILPVVYSWNFSAEEVKAVLGSEMSASQALNGTFADKLFTSLRVEYQGVSSTLPVIGGTGVKASDALSCGALALTKSDGNKGLHIEVTAYLANVSASDSTSGAKLVRSSGSQKLLVVPDGSDDGAIIGSMWMLQPAGTAPGTSGENTSQNTQQNSGGDNSGSSGEGGGGGGGCESLGLGLLSAVILFKQRR